MEKKIIIYPLNSSIRIELFTFVLSISRFSIYLYIFIQQYFVFIDHFPKKVFRVVRTHSDFIISLAASHDVNTAEHRPIYSMYVTYIIKKPTCGTQNVIDSETFMVFLYYSRLNHILNGKIALIRLNSIRALVVSTEHYHYYYSFDAKNNALNQHIRCENSIVLPYQSKWDWLFVARTHAACVGHRLRYAANDGSIQYCVIFFPRNFWFQ